jgi:hypothetical protein
MGWSEERHWTSRDPAELAEARRHGFRLAPRVWPPVRSAESTARMRALREGVRYRGPIDQDGYALPGGFDEDLPPLLDVLRDDITLEDSGEVTW